MYIYIYIYIYMYIKHQGRLSSPPQPDRTTPSRKASLYLAERLQIKGTQIGDRREIALLGLPFSTVCHDCLYNGVHIV